jgi:hypothetical protein
MSKKASSAARAPNNGIISYRASMIMLGVIATMIAALPIDPNKVTIAAMARGALTVGALVTIGSILIEILRKLLEDAELPNFDAIGAS